MTTIVYMRFDFNDLRLADRGHILGLMSALAQGDRFRFLKKAIVCDDMPGEVYVPNEPELLDKAWSNAVRAAPRYNGEYWMEIEGAEAVRMSLGFDPRRIKRLNLTIDRDLLKLADNRAAMAELMHAVETVCATLSPAYGYGLFNYDVHDELPIGAPPAGIWDINWFGPAHVEAFGRPVLERIDAWRHVEINGGRLIAMAEAPFTEWRQAAPHYREAASLLGLSAVYHDG